MPTFSVREMQAKTVINRVQGMPFDWSINPYRGCRHACVYCYARPTHEYLGLNGADQFQEVIFAKVNAPDVVRRELSRRSWQGDPVVIGTATDPYQQAESRYKITRGILEAFRDFCNPVSITTKSPMVLRDLDVLADLARHASVTVNFTVTTLDEKLWRDLEPTTPKPRKRLEAIRALTAEGIRCGVFLSPILPGLTDDPAHLEDVVAAARDYGAGSVHGHVLRLGPGISEYYLPFVKQFHPELVSTYSRLYRGKHASAAYVQTVEKCVDALKRKYRFHDEYYARRRRVRDDIPVQLPLLIA